MFGRKIVKNEENCWVLDDPLDPTHELDFSLAPTQARYNIAKTIDVHAYDVVMMMMSFSCSCRNKNQPKDIYPKGTSHIRGCLEGRALMV
jgi:hypothetical protein